MRKSIQFCNATLRLVTLVILTILLGSCSKSFDYSDIPESIHEVTHISGDPDSETVFVMVQGGPEFEIQHRSFLNRPQLLANDRNTLVVYPAQGQVLDTELPEKILSTDDAQRINEISVEILHEVVEYFSQNNEKVIVVSHSFGSFLVPAWLEKYGNEADYTVIAAGRLDMPEVVWKGFQNNVEYFFPEGVNPIEGEGSGGSMEYQSARIIAADLGQRRNTILLQDTDLRKVAYLYGEKDEAIGSLSPHEVDFLENKGAFVVKIEDGSHSSMFARKTMIEVSKWLGTRN